MSFTLAGFLTVDHQIRVALGFTTTLDVALKIAGHSEHVTVPKVSRVLDRHSTSIAPTFDSQQLADLPGSRNMSALLAIAPGVQMPIMDVGGSTGALEGPNGAYGTDGANRPMVEGIVVQGIFNSGFMLDYGTIQEASVLTAAHGVEWPTRGRALAVRDQVGRQSISRNDCTRTTRTGAGSRRTSMTTRSRRGAQGGDGVSAREANRLWNYRDFNADAGGFIIKDRLWWYSSFRDQDIASRRVNFPCQTAPDTSDELRRQSDVPDLGSRYTLVAYAQKGSNHQPNRLDPVRSGRRCAPSATAINETEDSTADQRNAGWVWKGEWNAVINDALLFEVRVGSSGRDRTGGH